MSRDIKQLQGLFIPVPDRLTGESQRVRMGIERNHAPFGPIMLDFSQVTVQIQSFTEENQRQQPQRAAALAEARRRLGSARPTWETTREKIENSRTSWLVARWIEPPDSRYPVPPRPLPHTVFAADGSQIVADRHDVAPCYLLNIGLIALRYGTDQRPLLTSHPTLHLPEDDLLDEFQGEQTVIAPRRLAIRRLLAELAGLAEMIVGPGPNSLALFDGSLILWTLEPENEAFRASALREFESYLETARRAHIPIAGYISAPQSRDVVNALNVFQCPHPKANCDSFCPKRTRPRPHYKAPDCAGTERITDAELFATLLQPGERSAVFGSDSPILRQYSPDNVTTFFYLHTGPEVARVEIPKWVADNPELLALTHTLCYDQARKGEGYPVALAEAHEQAIVRGAERDLFFRLIEQAFVSTHQSVGGTQKAVSKRARRI